MCPLKNLPPLFFMRRGNFPWIFLTLWIIFLFILESQTNIWREIWFKLTKIGALSSSNIGQNLTTILRMSINRDLFLLSLRFHLVSRNFHTNSSPTARSTQEPKPLGKPREQFIKPPTPVAINRVRHNSRRRK